MAVINCRGNECDGMKERMMMMRDGRAGEKFVVKVIIIIVGHFNRSIDIKVFRYLNCSCIDRPARAKEERLDK